MTYTATFRLDSRTKRRWVSALRSGKYAQGDSELYNPGDKSFCCLGVLCNISGVPASKLGGLGLPSDLTDYALSPKLDDADLVEYGIDVSDAESSSHGRSAYDFAVMYDGELTPLSVLNDEECLTFNEIADLIEKNVKTF